MTVLIVDDERDILDTLRDAFEDQGYRVEVASNGVEALLQLQTLSELAVVILDLVMPYTSGNEVLAAMQADPRFSPVSVIIATSDPSRAPSGVLTMKKPLHLPLLLDTVAKLCGRAAS